MLGIQAQENADNGLEVKIWCIPIMKLDWENKAYNIPFGLNFGKAFAKNLTMFLEAEYVVSGPGRGDFTIRLNMNAMFDSN